MKKIFFIALAISIFLGGTAFILIKAPSAITLSQDDKKKDKKKDSDKKKDGEKKSDGTKKDDGDKKKPDEKSAVTFPYDANVTILQTWTMPPILLEISGITWYDNNKMAMVQDELGSIFIYDLGQNKIEKEISFGPKGDYEGVEITPESFFVLRADGTLIEVSKTGSVVKEHQTRLTAKSDTEGMCYDAKNKRLLISLKAAEDSASGKRNVYSFSLSTYKLSDAPVFSINTKDAIFDLENSGKRKDVFNPSTLAVHPVTGEFYLTGGTNSSLLVINKEAKPVYYTLLNPDPFVQPEGIAFSPKGDLFIATEGVKGSGKIMKVKLVNKL